MTDLSKSYFVYHFPTHNLWAYFERSYGFTGPSVQPKQKALRSERVDGRWVHWFDACPPSWSASLSRLRESPGTSAAMTRRTPSPSS